MISWTETDSDSTIERRLGWLFALGGCILILDQTIHKVDQVASWATWWNVGGMVLAVAIVVLAIGGLLLPMPLLRAMWWAIPALYVLQQTLWVFAAVDPAHIPATPWTWTFEPVIVTMLLLIRPLAAIVASILISLLPTISSLLFLDVFPHPVLRETPLQVSNVLWVAIFIGVYQQLRALRREELAARQQRERQARAMATAAEHARLARLVHDEVLSGLAAAIQSERTPPEVLKRAAAGVLDALDESIGDFTLHEGDVPVGQAVQEIVDGLHAIDGEVMLHVELASGVIPWDAYHAVSLASAEALRNSLRHAGTGARRSVALELGDGRVRIVVSDDGVGFDPRVESEGMGIAESISKRMADVGGSASIRSRPGQGAEVAVMWTR